MSVDASIFAATAKRAEALRVWLHGLPPVLTTAREYFMCDRLSGARCLAVEILQIVPAVAESVLRLFPASPGATRKGSSERSGPTTAAWVTLSALTGVGRAAGSTDLNGRLFGACVQVFSNVDASLEWRPLEVLSEIERAVRAKKLIKKDDLELAKNFESIRGILRNEREFKPFKVGAGLDVAKSLLLLLLRPEPARLLSWPQSESGADAPVILTAATLCGLLAGREKLSVEIRAPDLDRVLADLAAGELSTSKDSLVLRPNAILGPLEIRRESGGRELLTAGATRIASWSVGPKSATEALLGFDLSGAESMKLALEICRILGWADCVRARVVVETGEVSVSTRGKGRAVEVEMSGWPELTLAVDASRFRERLTRDGVPRERENDVANLLGKVLE